MTSSIDSSTCIVDYTLLNRCCLFIYIFVPESRTSLTAPLGGAKRLLRCAVRDVRDSGTPFAGHILN